MMYSFYSLEEEDQRTRVCVTTALDVSGAYKFGDFNQPNNEPWV